MPSKPTVKLKSYCIAAAAGEAPPGGQRVNCQYENKDVGTSISLSVPDSRKTCLGNMSTFWSQEAVISVYSELNVWYQKPSGAACCRRGDSTLLLASARTPRSS